MANKYHFIKILKIDMWTMFDTAYTIWVKNLKFGHNILQIICQKVLFLFFVILIFFEVMALWKFQIAAISSLIDGFPKVMAQNKAVVV